MFGCQNAGVAPTALSATGRAGAAPPQRGITGYAAVVPELRFSPRETYTYAVDAVHEESVVPGARVRVPFGEREVIGHVVGRLAASDVESPRLVLGVLDEPPPLLPHLVELARWIAARYQAPLGEVVKAMLPAGIRSARPRGRRRGPRTASRGVLAAGEEGPPEAPPPLTEAQRVAAAPLLDAVAARRHHRLLLRGVTGSGKTEVYLAAITAALAGGRRALVLVPEISLTPQTIRRFAARFPGRVGLLHSALSEAERAAVWRLVRAGEVEVVVGSRSAVFAPLADLGVIVVDEEDASAYKQDRVPRYHAVETALELGRLCRAAVVLGSATPRVESFFRAHGGDLELATLPDRIGGRALPPIEVVDLREELRAGNRSPLSLSLERALGECAAAGGQSILFLNRRGTATVVVCRSCGEALGCANCSVALVYHQSRARCDCHYCGASVPPPRSCPACGSPAIRALGMGTERLEREVRERFPALRLLRMDRDTVQRRDTYFEIYDAFARGDADCLIGTQMVTKGWDLAGVRLVGIVNADTALHLPDYRSGEVTFSLLTQVAGRAGRGEHPARVILQTYTPGHYAIRHALGHDYLGFAHEEIRIRRAAGFPPYHRLCVCTCSHREDAEAERRARRAAENLSATLTPGLGIDVLGPTPAFLHRLRGEYRWQITVRGATLEGALPHLPKARGWSIDVDPAL
jgi:primosomal protein N' (replication factor Y) (superfamily II helicase)